MSATVAPILKIRTVLRERARTPVCERVPDVVSIDDDLMLRWAEDEVRSRAKVRDLLEAGERTLADVKALTTAALRPEREVSRLDALLLFTKIEGALGLMRQARDLSALACFCLLFWLACDPQLTGDDDHAMRRTRSGVRIVRTVRAGRRTEEEVA